MATMDLDATLQQIAYAFGCSEPGTREADDLLHLLLAKVERLTFGPQPAISAGSKGGVVTTVSASGSVSSSSAGSVSSPVTSSSSLPN